MQVAANGRCYLQNNDFVIISSYDSHLRIDVIQVIRFSYWQCGAFIVDTIFKKNYKNKKMY